MKLSDDILRYVRGAHEHAEIWRNPTPDQLEAIVTALVLAITLIQREPDGRAAYDRVKRAIESRLAAAQPCPSRPPARTTARRRGDTPVPPNLPAGAAEWLSTGERGISSETIFSHLTGIPVRGSWRQCPPFDPDDLWRCRLLLEAVPAFRAELPRMAELGSHWAAIVEHWDELCALMDAEAPTWRKGYGHAPRTCERMRQLAVQAGAAYVLAPVAPDVAAARAVTPDQVGEALLAGQRERQLAEQQPTRRRKRSAR